MTTEQLQQEQVMIHKAVEKFKYHNPNSSISNLRVGSGRVIVEGSNGEKVEL